MRKIKKIFISLFIFAVILYMLFLFVLPKVLSSHIFLNTIDDFISEKTGIIINSGKLNVSTSYDLLIGISADKLNITHDDKELLKIKNAIISFDLKSLKIKHANIEYIYLNPENFKNIVNLNKTPKKRAIKIQMPPDINIKKAEIWVENDVKKIFIGIENLSALYQDGKMICKFQAEIVSDILKNLINIGRNGYLYFEDNRLYADNLEVLIGNSSLYIDGKIRDNNQKTDFTLKGDNIPVDDTMSSLLYFQKSLDKSKKFIENFYDFDGKINADLRINEQGIFGECAAVKLSGKTVLFDVPILFNYVPFKFEGYKMSGGAFGILGGEKVYSDFFVNNIGKRDFETNGSVKAKLTNKSVSKYVPYASITGSTNVFVDYHIKNKKINVKYKANIPVNSDIHYQNVSLGLTEHNRNMNVETFKDGDEIQIKSYDYSIEENKTKKEIIKGGGLFKKINDKYTPQYITCATVEDTPVSVAGSFYKYLDEGVFNGNLKYDFNENKITGNFNIKNSKYKGYIIDSAKVNAKDDKVIVEANGQFRKSDFYSKIVGENNFSDKIHINSLYFFLDELNLVPKKKKDSSIKIDDNEIRKHTDSFDIDLYTIKLNKITYKKIILNDIQVKGAIKDEIFNFEAKPVNFANGELYSKGQYDFKNRISDVIFNAENINSNIAADLLFNLPNQIEGIGNAQLHIKTKNGVKDRNTKVKFNVKKGFLPKLGSSEFMIKNAKIFKKKYTLQDIVNIDMSNRKILQADINGVFDVNNDKIQNMEITSSHKFLSLLILGDYDREKQEADMELFGKYNIEEMSRIKIFFVPMSLIFKILFRPENTMNKYMDKINALPKVNDENGSQIQIFRVKLQGNINEKMEYEMKRIQEIN